MKCKCEHCLAEHHGESERHLFETAEGVMLFYCRSCFLTITLDWLTDHSLENFNFVFGSLLEHHRSIVNTVTVYAAAHTCVQQAKDGGTPLESINRLRKGQ